MDAIRPAERRQLTVLFCDMVASTPLSLRLDPEELAEVIQGYRQRVGEIVETHGGMVARHVGDGVLAYFGYPRAHENDAERAIRAALAVTRTEWPGAGAHDLRVHVGVATGVMVIGNLPHGGEPLSAIGSTLNLAARLEALAGPGEVVVSQDTQRLCRGLFEYRDLGAQPLKGFDAPVTAWQVLGERTVGSRFHMLRDRALTPLVDRAAELAELQRLWALAQRGHGQAVLLSSEAGVGKSRLTEALADTLDETCVRVWYHCSPNLQGSPLAPVIRQFTIAGDLHESDDDATKLRKVAGLVPPDLPDAQDMVALLAGLLSVRFDLRAAPLNVSPQRRKHLLFRGLTRLVEAVARARGPLLVVVEDLHWVDPSFDELIGMVLEHLGELPILAVLTARPEFRPHWGDAPHLHHVVLQPLSRPDAITMVGHICGERSLPDATMREIADRTDGMPLFIEDLTQGVLESTAGASGAAAGGAPRFPIPATLNDSLMSRLDRLGSAKAIAEIGRGHRPRVQLRASRQGRGAAGRDAQGRAVPIGRRGPAREPALGRPRVRVQARARARRGICEPLAQEAGDAARAHRAGAPRALPGDRGGAAGAPRVAFPGGGRDWTTRWTISSPRPSCRRAARASSKAIAQLESALQLLGTLPASDARARRELGVHRTLGGIYAEQRGFASPGVRPRVRDCARAVPRRCPTRPRSSRCSRGWARTRSRARASRRAARSRRNASRARRSRKSKPPFVMGHLLLGGTLFLEGELAAARRTSRKRVRLYEEDQPHGARGRSCTCRTRSRPGFATSGSR